LRHRPAGNPSLCIVCVEGVMGLRQTLLQMKTIVIAALEQAAPG
jgi:hypothetical protein